MSGWEWMSGRKEMSDKRGGGYEWGKGLKRKLCSFVNMASEDL